AAAPASDLDPRFVRTAAERPWSRAKVDTPLVSSLPAAFDPAALLGVLAGHDNVTISGGEEVNGSSTRVIHLPVQNILGMWVRASADVFVDDHNRPVRIAITAPTGSAHYDVTYGVPLNVTAPPAAEIQVRAPPRFQVTGPYAEVRGGATHGVKWS